MKKFPSKIAVVVVSYSLMCMTLMKADDSVRELRLFIREVGLSRAIAAMLNSSLKSRFM